jgi:hypothetical protein
VPCALCLIFTLDFHATVLLTTVMKRFSGKTMFSQILLLLHSGCPLSPVPCSLFPIFTLGLRYG